MTDYSRLPNKTQLDAYINDHQPVGGFLRAVLENDLSGAVGRADSRNLPLLPLYVKYIYNEAPGDCWGNDENVDAWLDNGETSC